MSDALIATIGANGRPVVFLAIAREPVRHHALKGYQRSWQIKEVYEAMLSKEVEFLVKLRDGLTMAAEAVNDYLETFAPKDAKQAIAEQTFNILKWECEEGTTLGKFEVAYQKANITSKWHHCYNILRNNNSLINSRFHEDGYVCAYWIYPEKYTDRIFRKKLGAPQL